jgi:hypothetical protein
VWAEARSAPKAGGGVVQVSRVGIRLYVSVGPGGPPAANFTIDALTAKRSPDGKPMVVASVHNTGGRALDMNGTLKLSAGPGGLSAGPFPASLGVTLPVNDTEPVSIALDQALPAGPWDAQITLRSGLVERTTRATITFPKSGAAAAVATSSGLPAWLYLIGGGIVALLFAPTTLFFILRRRRRRDRDQSNPAMPQRAQAAQPGRARAARHRA